jgi:hypothetical protein
MNLFIAVVFVVLNGAPNMRAIDRVFNSMDECESALERAADSLQRLPAVNALYAQCFKIQMGKTT